MENKKYRPSNGSEGDWFCDKFCRNCINGKYEHTMDIDDNPCEILTASFLFDIYEKEYPKEWVYDSESKPSCTAFVKFDWDKDDDGNIIDPPKNPDDDIPDNQLMLFSIADEVLENHKIKILEQNPT